jgi:GT2 family glycosyltransferase
MITEGSAAPTLCVSVVVHNSSLERLEATLRCLAAALRWAVDDGALDAVEVVLYDNASHAAYQDSLGKRVAALADQFPPPLHLMQMRSEENRGYGRGVNEAAKARDAEFLLVLNPDIDLAPDAIVAALACLKRRGDAVCVAPRCTGRTGEPEYLCKRYPAVLDLLLRGLALAPLERLFHKRLAHYEYRELSGATASEVMLVSGACMFMRRAAFDAVGGFDAGFFMYFEDFDLSMRLRERGALLFEPTMSVVHYGGYASRKGRRHIRWFLGSALRFYRRHGWRLL